jgi:hypothetical protein
MLTETIGCYDFSRTGIINKKLSLIEKEEICNGYFLVGISTGNWSEE